MTGVARVLVPHPRGDVRHWSDPRSGGELGSRGNAARSPIRRRARTPGPARVIPPGGHRVPAVNASARRPPTCHTPCRRRHRSWWRSTCPSRPGTPWTRQSAGHSSVLRDLSLDVAPGARIAVTGPSGSGKTTLAALLVRYLDPSRGRVDLGGTPVAWLRLDDLRSAVGLVDDDPHLFASTVAENIRLARPRTGDAEVAEALRLAHLSSWLESLPEGLDTWIGAGQATVSGGERARLGLARSLLADHQVLVRRTRRPPRPAHGAPRGRGGGGRTARTQHRVDHPLSGRPRPGRQRGRAQVRHGPRSPADG